MSRPVRFPFRPAQIARGGLVVVLGLFVGTKAFGQSYVGTFSNHVVTVTWSGSCDRPGLSVTTTNEQASFSLPLSRQAPGCANMSLQGNLIVNFPQQTPGGTIDSLNTIAFANGLQRDVTFNGQCQFTTTPDNTWLLKGDLSLDAEIYCTNAIFAEGSGLAAGAHTILLTRTCGKDFITFPFTNGTDLVYQIASFADVFVYAPNRPDNRVVFLVSIEIHSYYRVPIASGILLGTNQLYFDVEDTPPIPQRVSLENSGTSDLNFSVSTTTKDGGGWMLVDPLGGTLAPNQTTRLTVGIVQSRMPPHLTNMANITVSGNAPNSPQTMTVEVVQKVARLIGLEVVQVVQDWSNTVPLLQNKATTVRAHLQALRPERIPVTGKLHGSVAGQELGPPRNPDNGYIEPSQTADSLSRRAQLNNSLNFTLPAQWVKDARTITLKLEADGVLCSEPGTSNCSAIATFEPAVNLPLKFVDIAWTDAAGVRNTNSRSALMDLANRVLYSYPIRGVSLQLGTLEWLQPEKPDLDVVLETLDWMRVLESSLSSTWTDRIYFGAIAYDDTGGVGFTPGDAATGHVRPNPDDIGRMTVAHELAHTLGQHHAAFCGADASPGEPAFPYVSGGKPTLGPMTAGPDAVVFGYDHLKKRAISPEDYFELMSYCFEAPVDRWPSKFTYEQLLTDIDVRFNTASPPPKPSVLKFVRGKIDAATHSVTFSPGATLPAVRTPPSVPPGDYLLQALNASARVVYQVAFAPKQAKPDGQIPTALSFILAVPEDPAIRQIQVLQSNQVMGAISASANAPTVHVLFPNGGESLTDDTVTLRWSGADADGDALTYAVQYSPDDGMTWETLAADLSVTNYTISRHLLEQTTRGRIRVIASDGFLSAMAVSDGVFTTVANAPEIYIQAPAPHQLFIGNQQVVLEAVAYDTEDGLLEGTNVLWSSDLDGPLGDGTQLVTTAAALSEGTHVITATARDSSGLASTAQIPIIVLHTTIASIADLAVSQTSQLTAGGLTFTLTVENRGPSDATSVRLTDELPSGATLLSATSTLGACTVANGLAGCNIPVLPSGTIATVTVQFATPTPGAYTNVADVRGLELDPNVADNFSELIAQFTVPPPALSVHLMSQRVVLSWPTNPPGFFLESTLKLGNSSSWQPVTNLSPTVVGGVYQLTNSVSDSARYFRLHKP